MTLAHALQMKNRLIARLVEVSPQISSKNVNVVGNEREVDVRDLLAVRDRIVAKNIELKAAIAAANIPIVVSIYEIAALKATIGFLKGIQTTHGKVVGRRGLMDYAQPAEAEYEAEIRASEVEGLLRKAKRRIDVLQSGIDAHNVSTTIDVTVEDDLLY